MNLQQLRYAAEIAATGSISKAAKNLFMGQPNLSKSIKDLESEIGFALFARTPKGVVPTQSGEAFLGYARSIVAQMDSLAALYQPQEASTDGLHIAAPRASYVAEAFSRCVGANEACKNITYRETSAQSVITDVACGKADVGIVRFQAQQADYFAKLLHEQRLASQPLWEYHMVVLLHESHPLAALPEIPYRLLAQYAEIIHGDVSPIVDDTANQTAPFAPGRRIAVYDRGSQFDILRHVAGSYLWVSPMPFEILAREGLLQKPCHHAAVCRDVLVHRAEEPLRNTEQQFIAFLREEIKNLIQTK